MKILSALVLVGFMSSGCFVQADVKSAQDALVKAQAASRRAKTAADVKATVAAVKKAQADLEQARLDDKAVAALKAATAATSVEQANTAAAEVKAKTAQATVGNVMIATKAASIVLTTLTKAAAQKKCSDASTKQSVPALHLALAYLPVEFFAVKIAWSAMTVFRAASYPTIDILAWFKEDPTDLCNLTYQPIWGSSALTAKGIAQARKTANAAAAKVGTATDEGTAWDAVIAQLP